MPAGADTDRISLFYDNEADNHCRWRNRRFSCINPDGQGGIILHVDRKKELPHTQSLWRIYIERSAALPQITGSFASEYYSAADFKISTFIGFGRIESDPP